MKRILSLVLMLVFVLALVSCGGEAKQEENYPTKAITLIIPYGAGGTTDLVGRQYAIALEKQLGQKITVVNQGGASGSVGTKTVLDAKPDGYTILFTADSLGTQRVMGISEMSYDDFVPIQVVANDPKVIVVNKTSKYETIDQLIEDIKANPGKVKMSYTGPGGSGHVQALIYNALGLDMALTAYSSGMDCIVSVLGDQVEFTNSNYSTVASYIEGEELRLLAISSNERLAQHPEVPTLSEVIPEAKPYMEIPFTPLSLVVPKDVPDYVVEKLREASAQAVQDEDFNKFMEENSIDKLYNRYKTPDEMIAFFKEWESKVSWLLDDAGATKFSPEKFDIPRP